MRKSSWERRGPTGENPAVAIAPGGRAVAAWEGGPATAPVIQASVLPPGGTWSAPVNVSTDAFGGPVIGMDGSGNAIVAWTGRQGDPDREPPGRRQLDRGRHPGPGR